MKLIRRAATAFTLWIFALGVWAALSHITSLPGPARASTATLDRVAAALERADAPGALGAPQRVAAAQLRRTAHTAGRINGRIERAVGGWIDNLGHSAAHGRDLQVESPMHFTHPGGMVTLDGERRITIRVDARSTRRSRAPGGGVWIDRTEKAAAGSTETDLRLRAARHGEAWSLSASEAGAALDEAAIRLDIDANLDRKKLRERIEKLLDLLEELQNFEGGR